MKNHRISIIDQKGSHSPKSPTSQLSPISPFNQNKRDTKLQNQIQDVMQQLQEQKQEYQREKEKERQDLIKQKQKDQLKFQIMQTYQKSMAERKPFVGMPDNQHQIFERDRAKYLKVDGNFPDKNLEYFMQPSRAKDPKGFHVSSGNDSSSYSLFGKIDESKMSQSERRRYQIWEEIKQQKEKEQQELLYQQQNGQFKREIFYSSKLNNNNKTKVFKPVDQRNSLFTVNPSSLYDVPRTPKSTRKLIQLEKNIEKNNKWNPNTSSDGVFDKHIYKNDYYNKIHNNSLANSEFISS